jgi:two-component system chemotaxis sensor kinase CheA
MSLDPYKYFRIEARELVTELGKQALALEKESVSPGRIGQLLRLAHTLKGAARVVKQREIADHAHSLEDVLTPHRESGGPVPRSGFDLVLGLLDKMGAHVTALEQPSRPAEEAPRPRPPEETFRSVRTEVAEVDDLLDGITEVQSVLAHLGRNLDGLARVRRLADSLASRADARRAEAAGESGNEQAGAIASELSQACMDLDRTLVSGMDQMDRQLREVRQNAERIRLVAASVLFTPLERAARDIAQAQGKRVAFETSGGELRLDAHVLGIMQPALVQMVRNAVAHGIESEAERRAAGKPPEGKVRLEVTRRGRRVAFICNDDGRGVDFQAVRRIAAEKGLIPADAEPLAPEALMQKLLAGGISTSRTVSEMSGRGIGLDVVREAKERLGGELAVRTETGKGTAVEIDVPISLASLETLLVESAGAILAIPLDAIHSCLRVAGSQLARSGRGDTLVHGDRVIPFLPLARVLLTGAGALHRPDTWSAVLLQTAGGSAAIGVERLLGTQQIVLRPLPESCPASPVIAGATLDTEGNPRLVLDPDNLVAEALRAEAQPDRVASTRLPILVIDDSLTTRMLEQSILESAGFDVEVAVSAEDGLERARRERFALFLVDVEMPGMDGFSFIEQIRADPALRDIPSILVTSRNAPEDRRRGEEVGARGYMVKSEFNQGALLDRIRTLMA